MFLSFFINIQELKKKSEILKLGENHNLCHPGILLCLFGGSYNMCPKHITILMAKSHHIRFNIRLTGWKKKTTSSDLCFYTNLWLWQETLLGTGHRPLEQLPLASPGALRALSELRGIEGLQALQALLRALAQEVTDVLGHVLNEIPTLGPKSDRFLWGDLWGDLLGDHGEIIVNYNHEADFLGM